MRELRFWAVLGTGIGGALLCSFFAQRGQADCAQTVEELRLELVDLEAVDGASADAVEAERLRLAAESRLVGDYESEHRLEQTIVWDGPFQSGGGVVELQAAP